MADEWSNLYDEVCGVYGEIEPRVAEFMDREGDFENGQEDLLEFAGWYYFIND